MSEWVETARACPETAPRARQRWFKDTHGLGQNYATIVLEELAAEAGANPRDSAALRDALWSDPVQAAVFEKLQAAIDALSQAVTGQRKAYTSWSRATPSPPRVRCAAKACGWDSRSSPMPTAGLKRRAMRAGPNG